MWQINCSQTLRQNYLLGMNHISNSKYLYMPVEYLTLQNYGHIAG